MNAWCRVFVAVVSWVSVLWFCAFAASGLRATALRELHQYELCRNSAQALLAGYEELALTLMEHAARAIISNDQHQVKGAIISAELCDVLCNKQMLETKWMIAGNLVDQFGQPASASSFDVQRTMLRTGHLLVEHGIEAAGNPLPLLGSVALTAACPPAALALFTADLVVHHKELFQSSKQFYQLLKDDTPEGAARLIAFSIELVALHKATQATLRV